MFTYSSTRIKDQVLPTPYLFTTFICTLLQQLWFLWTMKEIVAPTSNESLHSEKQNSRLKINSMEVIILLMRLLC